jgi:hypothetical protein
MNQEIEAAEEPANANHQWRSIRIISGCLALAA